MIDYYAIDDPGCCLVCDYASPGCLCYDCKCSKCEWYNPSGHGRACGKVDDFEDERRQHKREQEYLGWERKHKRTDQKTLTGDWIRENTLELFKRENRKERKECGLK